MFPDFFQTLHGKVDVVQIVNSLRSQSAEDKINILKWRCKFVMANGEEFFSIHQPKIPYRDDIDAIPILLNGNL